MKTFLKAAALLGFCCVPASAAIIVNSVVTDTAGGGVRAQAVLENKSTLQGDPLGVAIKEFRGTIIIRDDVTPPPDRGGPALSVTKRQLTAAQTWGAGQPLGYDGPPPSDPAGPWQGLMWPFRDPYDYFNNGSLPLADDVGTPFFDDPDVYGFLNIVGIQRGGPTDPAGPPSQPGIAWVRDRGEFGTGVADTASYFAFDLAPLTGDPNRFVRVRVIGASAVVVQDLGNGEFSEVLVPVPDSDDFFIRLPEPSSATLATIGLGALLARRRQK